MSELVGVPCTSKSAVGARTVATVGIIPTSYELTVTTPAVDFPALTDSPTSIILAWPKRYRNIFQNVNTFFEPPPPESAIFDAKECYARRS